MAAVASAPNTGVPSAVNMGGPIDTGPLIGIPSVEHDDLNKHVFFADLVCTKEDGKWITVSGKAKPTLVQTVTI